MRNFFVLGLTGPSGAGKSLAARHFAERGFKVIDADMTARKVVEPGSPCLAALAEAFGGDIIRPDGSLDRKKVAKLAFSGGRVEQLNKATHPFIFEEIKREVSRLGKSGEKYILIDAPTLYESGCYKLCDKVAAVLAKRKLRMARIMARDGISEEQVRERVDVQPDDRFYESRVDFVARSDKGSAALFAAVDHIADAVISERGDALR